MVHSPWRIVEVHRLAKDRMSTFSMEDHHTATSLLGRIVNAPSPWKECTFLLGRIVGMPSPGEIWKQYPGPQGFD